MASSHLPCVARLHEVMLLSCCREELEELDVLVAEQHFGDALKPPADCCITESEQIEHCVCREELEELVVEKRMCDALSSACWSAFASHCVGVTC